MWVSLDRQVEPVVEGDDSGVVDEDRPQPACVQLVGGPPQGGEQAVVIGDLGAAVGAGVRERDASLERLVGAVLGPGLGQGLQFGVGGVAAGRGEVSLDRSHLAGVERQQPVPAEVGQLLVVQAGQRNRRGCQAGDIHRREGRRQLAAAAVLDGRVGQQPLDQHVYVGVVEVAAQLVSPGGGCSQRPQAQRGGRPFELASCRVGNARDGRHLHHLRRGWGRADDCGVGHGVDQHLTADPIDVVGTQAPVEVVHHPAAAATQPGHAQFGGRGHDALLVRVIGGAHLDPCHVALCRSVLDGRLDSCTTSSRGHDGGIIGTPVRPGRPPLPTSRFLEF